jgi:hypothetical protein
MRPLDKKSKPTTSVSRQVLLFWYLLAQCQAMGQASPPKPARIVTEYALTSAQDFSNSDPEAWRLLGSNDDGRSWTTLDVQTNQLFRSRSQRRVFGVNNQAAYNAYRRRNRKTVMIGLAVNERSGAEGTVPLPSQVYSNPMPNATGNSLAGLWLTRQPKS